MADGSTQPCPRCGNLVDAFQSIEPGMRLALQTSGEASVPDKVCLACFDALTGAVSQGAKLRMERDVREKNKVLMWKNRVHLIKNARNMMNQKAYSEAAVQYEKYLRVLEVVYNLNKGELSPAVFNNSSRSKELTVIASVYWDLVRIYDTNPKYGDRMQKAAAKLAQFLQFSPIFPDIVRKAESFLRTAKNPAVIRQLLKTTKSRRGPCFIATVAFSESPEAVELHWLRQWRDQVLRPSWSGRQVIWSYYQISPPLARWLKTSPRARSAARWGIAKIARHVNKNLKSNSRLDVLEP